MTETLPDTVRLDLQEAKKRVQFNDAIHHWSAGQAPTISRLECVASLCCLRFFVLDALRLIEDNSVKRCLARVKQGKFNGSSSVVEVAVSASIFFHVVVQPLQLLGNSAVGGQNDIVGKKVIN